MSELIPVWLDIKKFERRPQSPHINTKVYSIGDEVFFYYNVRPLVFFRGKVIGLPTPNHPALYHIEVDTLREINNVCLRYGAFVHEQFVFDNIAQLKKCYQYYSKVD